MRHLATYMLEVAVCGGILQAVYSLLLERRIRFRWCRIYLLATTLLAAIIPLLRIPVWPGEVITVAAATTPVEGFAPAAVPTAAAPQTMPAEWLVYAVWALGTLFLLGLMAVQVLRIRRLKRGAEIVRTPRYTLVHTPQRIASFSFLNTIYVWQQPPAQEMEAILRHEASHIAHRHTIEHIVMESLKALLWWNPFAWIAARRLIEAEEFEADSDVLEGGYDRELYMNAIFRQLFGYSPEIANGLRDSLTKKRFKMMTSQKPGRYALLRLAGALPAIAGLLCAFSFTSRAAQIRTDTPSTDRAVYLINGTEIAPERIRKIDPEQLTLEKALQGEQIPAEYRQRNAEFIFLFTAEEPRSASRANCTTPTALRPKGSPSMPVHPSRNPSHRRRWSSPAAAPTPRDVSRSKVRSRESWPIPVRTAWPDCTPIQATVPTPARYPLRSTPAKPKAEAHRPAPPTWYGPR